MSDYSDEEEEEDNRQEVDIACDWSDGYQRQHDPLFNLHCKLCSCPLSVTFMDFSERQAVVSVLPCNHCFHSVCLDDYSASASSLASQLVCPVFQGPSLACAELQRRQRREREQQHRESERERLAEQQREEAAARAAPSPSSKRKKGGAAALATAATAAIAKALGKKKRASPKASKKTGKS